MHDFAFIHYKSTDAAGEDGDFEAKIGAIEESGSEEFQGWPEVGDQTYWRLAGDHSTPATMAAHSWHSVPLLINSAFTTQVSGTVAFNEKACSAGQLGTQPATSLMLQLLAHAGKLKKFGA